MLGIDSSNSLPDYAMFGRLEDSSWFMWMRITTVPEYNFSANDNIMA